MHCWDSFYKDCFSSSINFGQSGFLDHCYEYYEYDLSELFEHKIIHPNEMRCICILNVVVAF